MIPNEIITDNISVASSVILGFLFGLFYEVFRLLRIAVKPGKIALIIQDFIYFIPVTAVFLIFNFIFCSGEYKYFVFLGIFAGFFIYFKTLGKIINRFSNIIIGFIKKTVKAIIGKTLLPIYYFFVKILHLLFTKLKTVVIMIVERYKKIKIMRRKKRFLLKSEKGFRSKRFK